MKAINLFAITFLAGALVFGAGASFAVSPRDTKALIDEARSLLRADEGYLNARLKNDWDAIYSFQHPNYKKVTSIEEFKYFEGHLPINYREDKTFQRNVSGVRTYPSVKDIKRDPIKKAPFSGVPVPPTYRFVPPLTLIISGQNIEKVYLDESGKLGKAVIRLHTSEGPVLLRGLKIKRDILYVDHWEKIGEKWFLAITKPYFGHHVSGADAVANEHSLPVDSLRWSKAHFDEFKVEELK